MAIITSVPTFIRTQLQSKGTTVHNGRGCFEMTFDCDGKEVIERVKHQLANWTNKGLIKEVVDTDDLFEVVFKNEVVKNQHYKSFFVSEGRFFGVPFTK